MSDDVWAPLRFLVGSWTGTGEGESGLSTVTRTYQFVLGGRFLEARNRSVYAPQEKNPKGETHEDLGLFSYDKARGQFVLRQFHVEGFVNQYLGGSRPPRASRCASPPKRLRTSQPAGKHARPTRSLAPMSLSKCLS